MEQFCSQSSSCLGWMLEKMNLLLDLQVSICFANFTKIEVFTSNAFFT